MAMKEADKENIEIIKEIIKKVSGLLSKKYKVNQVLAALSTIIIQDYQDCKVEKKDFLECLSAQWDLCKKVKND